MTHPEPNLDKAFDLLNLELKIFKPHASDFENFCKALNDYLQKLPALEHDQEKRTEQAFTHFLQTAFSDYQGNYVVESVEDIDLTINRKNEERPSVLIECKKPSETKDFPRNGNLNVKALHQLVYYYLKETIEYRNTGIKSLIITNGKELYIFDEATFNRCFGEKYNKILKQEYQNKLDGKRSTEEFYTVVRHYLEEHPETFEKLSTLRFSLEALKSEFKEPLKSRRLQKAYKALCKFSLLKEALPNTGNTLNQAFYDELLHIIGLEEVKVDGKKLIQRKQNTPESASLIESILSQNKASFDQHTTPQNIDDKVIELVITWVNRILFLKLLEAQLVRYHKGNQTFKFMGEKYLTDWDHLNQLFFDVLAVKEQERSHDARVQALHFVPYLNSSLFERSELEQQLGTINNLTENELGLHPKTVLKHHGKRRTGKMKNIDYLLSFLDAYDFGSDAQDDGIQHNDKTLINASVLGLVFEKINGYKEGSFYTPSVITMYMCKESLRLAVLQKLNDAFDWQHSEWQDLKMACVNLRTEEKIKASDVINQLKICDPAVGSGHFLVSALNELLAIKADLELLVKDGRVYPLDIRIVNDELVIQDDYADGLFQYHVSLDGLTQKRSVAQRPQAIQELLFDEKRTLIEQCLFGVDINPNSVQICRLRLWIELLKNTYYKGETGYKELETLPNIDINIKCGNSLISRFGLNQKVDGRTTKGKAVQELQELTRQYYHVDRSVKKILETRLNDIKSNLNGELLLATKTREDRFKQETLIRDLKIEVDNIELVFNNPDFMSFTKETKGEGHLNDLKGDLVRKRLGLSNAKVKLKQLDALIEAEDKNPLFSHSFEWRFEFPDVLHPETGDFEGFDVVIGNPPYGVSIKDGYRAYLLEAFDKVPDYEIYYYFTELAIKLLKPSGILSYIIPNTFLFNVFASQYRMKLLNYDIPELLDCSAFQIFDSATVINAILTLQTLKPNQVSKNTIGYKRTKDAPSFDSLASKPLESITKSDLLEMNQNWSLAFLLESNVLELVKKLKNQSKQVEPFYSVSQGYIPYRKSDLIKQYGKDRGTEIVKNKLWHSSTKKDEGYKQEIFGRDFDRYSYKKQNSFVNYGKHLATYVDFKYFQGFRLIVREIINPSIIGCMVEEPMVHDPQIISIINNNPKDIKLLWAILNSKLATFYVTNNSPKAIKGAFPKLLIQDIKTFPLPEISQERERRLEGLVQQVMAAKKHDSQADITELEAEIDVLVYQLYQLTYGDVRVIDPDFEKKKSRGEYESGLI